MKFSKHHTFLKFINKINYKVHISYKYYQRCAQIIYILTNSMKQYLMNCRFVYWFIRNDK